MSLMTSRRAKVSWVKWGLPMSCGCRHDSALRARRQPRPGRSSGSRSAADAWRMAGARRFGMAGNGGARSVETLLEDGWGHHEQDSDRLGRELEAAAGTGIAPGQ